MANAELSANTAPPPRAYAPVAALLSYLVPGLGQIVQGRVAKGVLFLVCLYGLFFYGMYLGNWRNVYIPETAPPRDGSDRASRVLDSITDRAKFAGQFWIGAAAWPAIVQHFSRPSAPQPGEDVGDFENRLRNWRKGDLPHGMLGNFMRAPDEAELNDELRNSDKKYELGWMYTVIAGVLNILVIYDAFAGAAFGAAPAKSPAPPREPATPQAEPKKEGAAVA
jgi:hypothetical protein